MKSDENRWVDLSNGVAWAIIFSLAAIIMSIIALATRYPRTDLSLDYMGVIVGILTLLVTALVGWQVYNAISYDKRISEIEEAAHKNLLYSDARVCFTQGVMIFSISSTQSNQSSEIVLNNYCIAYRNFLEALIKYHGTTKDIQAMISCLDNMERCLAKLEKGEAAFGDRAYNKCDTLYNELLYGDSQASQEMLTRLSILNSRRKALAPKTS